MDTSPLDGIEERVDALGSLPIESRVEELGQIHNQLKSFLGSPSV